MNFSRLNFRIIIALALVAAGAWRQIAREPRPSVLSPGLRLYAYVGNTGEGTVTAVDLVSLRAVATIPVGPAPSGLRSHPTRSEIWGVSTSGGYAWVIDAQKGEVAARIPIGGGAFALDFSPDGKWAYIAASDSGTVSAIDCEQRRVIASAHMGRQPWVVRVTADGARLVVTLRGASRIAVLDAQSLRELNSVTVAPQPEQLFLLPPPLENKAFVSAAGSQQVSVVDLGKHALLANLPLGAAATDFVFNPRGEIYAMTPGTNGMTVLDAWRNEVTENKTLGNSPIRGVLTRGEDPYLFVVDAEANQIRPVIAEFRQPLRPIPVGQRPVNAQFTDDEALLLVVNETSEDLTVISRISQSLTQRQPPPFTLIPLGSRPRDLAIKLF